MIIWTIMKQDLERKARIDSYTKTASMSYKLEYTELALKTEFGYSFTFKDKDVHKVLMNSGVHKVQPNGATGEEWFATDIETVKAAIKSVKNGKSTLSSSDFVRETRQETIDFREEQINAIEKTLKTFKKDDEMLWYAKMRFGKTLSALEVIRRSQYRRVIIATHRPVVDDGWSEDFKKIFFPGNSEHEYHYERKTKDSAYTFDEKTDAENDLKIRKLDKDGTYFVYFASVQDLRGSKIVGGKFNKNNAVFALDWDLIIIDEAHEGTQTELGDNVVKALKKDHTKVLALSGTPFNLLDKFGEDNVYTWDYVMEQKKKTEWDLTHQGDHNPYADLPKMHIFTYDLGEKLKKYVSDEYDTKAFNFREFFRVWYKGPNGNRELPKNAVEGKFVHENDVNAFLNLMVREDTDSGYPYSTQEYRDMFRHTLWMVPGVKEAQALSELLRNHPVFKHFGIANVAGKGDRYEEEHSGDALELVRDTIKNYDHSITLSCGKLTTGVTVKEWTAVLMLSGSYSTAAAQYMQTIFRVQSAGTIDGKQKTDCYVFDFAPDRTLKVLTETVHLSRKPGKSQQKRREAMTEFLNYCPVIAISGSKTRTYSVESMMEQIKQIYAERAVNSGFEDESLYNDELLKLDEIDASKFNELKDIIGASKASKKKKDVVVNGQGLTDEQVEHIDDPEPPTPPKDLTKEEQEERKKKKQAKEARKKAIDILRGVSIRMPLMIYGADVPIEEDIDINRFVDIIDDESWKEFMPTGVSKKIFTEFTKYYDRDVFIAAGKRIRRLAAAADRETPTRRVIQIAEIFRHFKNPDKETVLTPWRVVNMHMSETLGGWCFYNDKFEEDTQEKKHRLEEPRFVDHGEVTEAVFAKNSKILEINSKTDYPDAIERLGKGTGNMLVSNFFEKVPEAIANETNEPCLRILCRVGGKRSICNILKKYIQPNKFIDKYNVASPEANSNGRFGERLTVGELLSPEEGATDTFISLGAFDTKFEALALQKYMKTKFFRALLGVKKVTQHCPPMVWEMIPCQEFSENSDIDWSKSIHEIDLLLYKKYGLSDEEIAFIESKVKPMDGTSYYESMLKTNYQDIVSALLKKYGSAKHNYFKDTACKIKNPLVTRTNEGLFCHHIDEDKAIMLCNDKFAVNNPLVYQKADRLVYCNLLEHLLLHVKIAENPSPDANENELPGIGGAINFICKDLNDIYSGKKFSDEWRKNVADKVKDNFDDYIIILRYLWNIVEKNPVYKAIITKEMLCVGWDGKVVKEVMNALNANE